MPVTEISLYGQVGDSMFSEGTSASTIIAQIRNAGDNAINLHINSEGGSVFDGYAIFNALKQHKPGVTIYVDGLAASIASYIAMAGTEVFMAANAMLMIHMPTTGSGGTSEDLRKDADVLDKITESLVRAYSDRTGIPGDEISKMLDEETWLDANQALAFGFVDGITDALEMAAKFDVKALSKFKNVPQSLKDKITNQESRSKSRRGDNAGKESIMTETLNPAANAWSLTTEAQVTTVATPSPQTSNIEPQASADRPSIFSRVKSMLVDKAEFVNQIAVMQAAIEERDQSISNFEATLAATQASLANAQIEISQYKAAETDLQNTVDTLKTDAKTASDKAIDIVAAAGFPQDKLPAVQPEGAVKSAQQFLDQYNAITNPAERTKFLREHAQEIKAANAELAKAAKS